MNFSELWALVATDIAYPADQETVIARIGDVHLDAPGADGEDVRATLAPLAEDRYETPEELFTTIIGSVGDQYIGRKYYDDRDTNPDPTVVDRDIRALESF